MARQQRSHKRSRKGVAGGRRLVASRLAAGWSPDRWTAHAFGLVCCAVQVVYVAASSSQFRLPKMAAALAGFALVSAAWIMVRHRQLTLPWTGLTATLVVYPVMAAVSAVWSVEPMRSLELAAAAMVCVVAALVLSQLESAWRGLVLAWTGVGFCGSAVVLLLQASGHDPLGVHQSLGASRLALTGLAGNPSDMAMVAVLLIPLAVWRSAERPNRGSMRLIVVIVLLATVVALTRNLTGLVTLAAMAGVWLLHQPPRIRWIGGASAAFLLALVVITAPGMRARVSSAAAAFARGDVYAALSAREDGWSAGLRMVQERPLLGVGAGAYDCAFFSARLAWLEDHRQTGRRGELSTHFEWAHNEPLQVVSELGVVGWLWLVALIGTVGTRIWRLQNPLWAQLLVVSLLPFLLLHYPTRVAVSLVPLMLALAVLLASGEQVTLPAGGVGRWLWIIVPPVLAGLVVLGQTADVRHDLWRARAEVTLQRAASSPPRARRALLAVLGDQVEQRLEGGVSAAWLYRIQGRRLLLLGEPVEAERAFRAALAGCSHSEGELGLGLALAAQGNRSSGIAHLARACTVNPMLLQLVEDRDLRQTVKEAMAISAPELQ